MEWRSGAFPILKIGGKTPTLRSVIALIDYGSGNLRSVEKALRKVGADVQLVRGADGLTRFDAMVLPGVGAFDDCITALQRQELYAPIRAFIASGKPFLGICVGYQALFNKSEEFNSRADGLGVFEGTVVRFGKHPGLKIPQIGWNQLQITRPNCPLYEGVNDGAYVYFVHSYYPRPKDDSIVVTQTHYGDVFASSIWKGNVFATQFHPEKSQEVGLRILKNFAGLRG